MFKRWSKRIRRFWAALALLSVEMSIVLCLFVIALIAFLYITRKIFIQHKTTFDMNVIAYLRSHISDRNTEVMNFFTFLGTHKFLIPANLVLIAYFLLVRRDRWYSIKVPAIALSSLGLMFLLKHLFNRQRPTIPVLEQAAGLSFPSGHALMSVTFYGLLIYIIFKTYRDRDWKWVPIFFLIVLILVIGFSRIYLRVHYASDVIAGYCIGFLWLVFAIWLLNHIEQYSRRKLSPIVENGPGPQPAAAR